MEARMIIDVNNPKLIRTHMMMLSTDPLRGLLTLETDQGQSRIEMDEDSANGLLDEVLALFGVPRPPVADVKTSPGL
jgi:hypothetical protein